MVVTEFFVPLHKRNKIVEIQEIVNLVSASGMTIPQQVKAGRKREKITQEQLARRVGCPLSAIRNLEQGKTTEMVKLLGKIGQALGTPIIINQ